MASREQATLKLTGGACDVSRDVRASDITDALWRSDPDDQTPKNKSTARTATEACTLEDEVRELRTAVYYRTTAAARRISTASAAAAAQQYQAVTAAHVEQLLMSYRRHFEAFSASERRPVTQLIPPIVWEKVYAEFQTAFSTARFDRSLMRLHLREALLSKSQQRQPPSPSAALGDSTTVLVEVTASACVATSVSSVAVKQVGHLQASLMDIEPTSTGLSTLLARSVAPTLAPAPQSDGPISTVNNHEEDKVVEEMSELPSPQQEQELEEQHQSLKRRVASNQKELQELKKQKLTLEHLKLALKLGAISRVECMEQGALVVADLCR